MPTRKPRKTVHLEAGVWYDTKDDKIHIAAKGDQGFITTVNRNPASLRGHPNLFRKLAQYLRDHDTPAPEEGTPDS